MAPEREARRLAAILAADMVGYSRLMQADERDTIARHRAHRKELIDLAIAEHGGRIVKTMGDGILVEFPSIVAAGACAVDVQRAMPERETELPEDRRIRYRVGINLGDIVIDGDDILGDGVNVAARLEALADPGGICIPRKVLDEVRNKLDLGYEFIGEQKVKNIEAPIPTYRVRLQPEAAGMIVGQRRPGPPATAPWCDRCNRRDHRHRWRRCLLVASPRAGCRTRQAGLAAARQALDRRAAVRQPLGRFRVGVVRGRHARRFDYGPVEDIRPHCDRQEPRCSPTRAGM